MRSNKSIRYRKALLKIQNTLIVDIQNHKPIKDTVNKIFDIIGDALSDKEIK